MVLSDAWIRKSRNVDDVVTVYEGKDMDIPFKVEEVEKGL